MKQLEFIQQYVPKSTGDDLVVPRRVQICKIKPNEISAQVLYLASEYLRQKHCPCDLSCLILRKFSEKVDKIKCFDEDVFSCDEDGVINYQPLKLMHRVFKLVDDICMEWKEDEDDLYLKSVKLKSKKDEGDCAPNFFQDVFGQSIKNRRRTLEDKMTILPNLDAIYDLKFSIHYFAIFDGHNGLEAASYCASQLYQNLVKSVAFEQSIETSLKNAFKMTDEAFLQKCEKERCRSGTTALVSLIMGQKLYIAWVGDSQAILVRKSDVVGLVNPHVPERQDECVRIKDAGGEVFKLPDGCCRVDMALSVSRAIGDADYKNYIISSPDINSIELSEEDEFLVLGCDGLWSQISEDEVGAIVRQCSTTAEGGIHVAARSLVDLAVTKGSQDNITVIVVKLQ